MRERELTRDVPVIVLTAQTLTGKIWHGCSGVLRL